MLTSKFRPPALPWAIKNTRKLTSPSRRGPRNSLRPRGLPQPISMPIGSPIRNNAPSTSSSSTRSTTESTSSVLQETPPEQNNLLAPVHIPEDPNAVLKDRHPAARLLANSGLVIQRELELMNVMLGFEQANRYVILDATGKHVGYMAEQGTSIGKMITRQWFRTHRSFVTHVFDREENEVLRFYRPFSWINSRIRVYDPVGLVDPALSPTTQGTSPTSLVTATSGSNTKISPLVVSDMRVVGEAQQRWAPLRRKYDLFMFHPIPQPPLDMGKKSSSGQDLSPAQQNQLLYTSNGQNVGGVYHQFAYVDEPFLSWDFSLRSADKRLIGSVNRNFAGFAREIFTDTGVYALRMDAASLAEESEQRHIISHTGRASTVYDGITTGMTLDQRAVMLATAVSIDFDYFSRHSHAGGGFFPLWFPGIGSEATAGGVAAGEAGGAGVGEAGVVGRAGAAGAAMEETAVGVGGAGAMAGYGAMRGGMSDDYLTSYPQEPQQQNSSPQIRDPEEEWGQNDSGVWGPGGGAAGNGGVDGAESNGDDGDFDWF